MNTTALHSLDRVIYPIGIQTFREIREGGYLYVDKTQYIAQLLKGKYYFLSRPRRFGKSLLLSTIEAYFRGERELFRDLYLDSFTDDWEPHPVLHLDLNNGIYDTPEELVKLLEFHLSEWEKEFGIVNDAEVNYGHNLRFGRLIKVAAEKCGKKVVILVDEYDKPLLSAVNDANLSDKLRNILKAFYSNLKTMDRYIEFAMLTGVARFSKETDRAWRMESIQTCPYGDRKVKTRHCRYTDLQPGPRMFPVRLSYHKRL